MPKEHIPAERGSFVESYVVICRGDRDTESPDTPAPYELATRRVFDTRAEATEYASGISPSREAMVVPGDFYHLRSAEKSAALAIEEIAAALYPDGDLQHECGADEAGDCCNIVSGFGYDVLYFQYHVDCRLDEIGLALGMFEARGDRLYYGGESIEVSEFEGGRLARDILDALSSCAKGDSADEVWAAVCGK